MSLVGFKAQNHPQQSVKDHVDDRGTDREFFEKLDKRFHFTVDVAAAPHNTKCERYYTIDDNGLDQAWDGERVWCNPPYSNIEPWVRKAHETWLAAIENGTELFIAMLLPANRTEQRWWQTYVEPHRDRECAVIGCNFRVEFLPGRMRFDRPGVVIGPKGDRPPFGCCLLTWWHEARLA